MRTPAWNYSATNHVPWVANLPPLSTKEAESYDLDYRNRWRTLLSVDDLVEGIVNELRQTNTLDRTYVLYVTSSCQATANVPVY
jgi:N-acetylglucosamine-6-sulfatase